MKKERRLRTGGGGVVCGLSVWKVEGEEGRFNIKCLLGYPVIQEDKSMVGNICSWEIRKILYWG